jgi:hypothetical protein
MNQRVRSRANKRAVERAVSMCKPRYAAQGPLLRLSEQTEFADLLDSKYPTDLSE